MTIYIQGCKFRDWREQEARLKSCGFTDIVPVIDESDYSKTRDEYRLIGVQRNFVKIMRMIADGEDDYPLTCQDDVFFPDPEKIRSAVERDTAFWREHEMKSILMYYCLRNAKTEKAKASWALYAKADRQGLYPLFMIFPKALAVELLKKYDEEVASEPENVVWEATPSGKKKVCGEDWFIQRYMKELNIPMYWRFPIMVKHGNEKSTLGNDGTRREW